MSFHSLCLGILNGMVGMGIDGNISASFFSFLFTLKMREKGGEGNVLNNSPIPLHFLI